ncbi:carboxypeptidase regulatory-like domain-containing protein, partial [Patescibacteria group bacterium]|nr:carboxypeptidase regulatory-like domain-containing protein [Patescibacteria group bacterium]
RSKDVFNVVVTKNNTIVNERRVSGTTKSDFDITESGYYIARVSSVDEAGNVIGSVKTTSLIAVLLQPSINENDYLLYGVPKQFGNYNTIITATDEFDAKTESSLALNVAAVCGDGIMQASNSEVCDGADGLDGQSCLGVNNNVLCDSTCSAMYCSNGGVVYAGMCGDAVRQGPEICESGETSVCNTLTDYAGTKLCAAGCAAWSNECTSALFCGDRIVNGTEQCEAPGNGTGPNNQYACTNCRWTGGYCGDSVGQGAEICDGSDLKGGTCASQGFKMGTLACNSDCKTFNTSACINTATLTGNVKAVKTGANIAGATITVAGKTATTDAAGNFSITDLQTNATYTATIVANGFANNTSYSFNFTGATNIEPYLFPAGWPGGVLAVVTRWNGKPTDLDLYMAKDTNESISLPYNTATAGGVQASYNTVPKGGMVSNGDMYSSVGQEMITITAVDTSKIYHAYAKDASSLQGYDANVRALVFDGTGRLIKTLNGASQPTSKYWNPFKITFTSATNFTVTDVNTYSN